jgi:UDP-N-acetylglucosamine/UDP-N-acetylgalactosamine diphosphorylase
MCINYFSRPFLIEAAKSMIDKMPLHVAHKAIPYYDGATGQVVKPATPNGVKLELFIFDTFPFSKKFVAFEIDRNEEFSPVKNAPGSASDSPDTARALVSASHKKWAAAAGATVTTGDGVFEIAPALSYGGEGLDSVCSGKEFATLPYELK